jgi:hypothetical protein
MIIIVIVMINNKGMCDVQMMYDFRGMREWEVNDDDFEGLECLGFGAPENEGGVGSAGAEQSAP